MFLIGAALESIASGQRPYGLDTLPALKAQAAQIQKVSDQLKTQVVAPLVVADN